MTKITKEEFIDQVDGWPEGYDRIVEVGVNCSDEEIAEVCANFAEAQQDLEELLERLGVELG